MKAGIVESKKTVVAAPQPNTFIGGVAATIPTKTSLASKLNILESDISYFAVVGSGIEAGINSSYSFPNNCFENDLNITSYLDKGGKVAALSASTFYQASNLEDVSFPNATSTNSGINVFTRTKLKRVYIPRMSQLGVGTAAEGIFIGITTKPVIYCDPSLATAASGSEEGDIAQARSLGATIRYVQNFTAPETPALSIGNIYSRAVQLNVSITSTNPIDYYEVYLGGVFQYNIISGEYLVGLSPSTSYNNITVIAFDIYYNKSIVSNSAPVTTNTTPVPMPTRGLVSHYKLDDLSGVAVDSFGTNDGTVYGITRGAAGKFGTAYSFNGNGDYIDITGITSTTKEYTFSWWMDAQNLTKQQFIFDTQSGRLLFGLNGTGNIQIYDGGFKSFNIKAIKGSLNHYEIIISGGKATLKINGVKAATELTVANRNIGGATTIGQPMDLGAADFEGVLDSFSIYEVGFTDNESRLMFNSGYGTTL